jgi:protein ImuB
MLYACLRSPRWTRETKTPDVAVAVAKDFSPRLQRYGSDCVVLDVGGLGRLLGEPQAIGDELTRACAARSASRDEDPQRSARVAVAPTQVGAMLLSSAHPGLTVVTGDLPSALAPMRLEVLRHVLDEIHGGTMVREKDPRRSVRSASREENQRSEKAFEVLQRWGLTTLGECAALPAGALSARLGQAGIALQRMARGVDSSPLVPDPDVPRFLERVELEWPIDGLEPLAFVLARLLEPLSSALERADRGAAAIHLDLRLVDRTRHARVLQLPAAMRDAKVLRTLLVLDLESHPPRAAIDIVAIEVDPAPGRVLQYSLLERARPSAETLATLTARLGALVGESRCGQPVLLDSHGPDAFEMRRFAPDEPVAATSPVASAFRRKDQQPQSPLAAPPPVLESTVLRRFRPPIAIRVAVERGRPRHVVIDRRGMPGGHVEQCAGPWRSSGAWWCAMSGGASRPWNRDEWDVALSDGSVCRVFQARDTEQWFLDGVVD